MSHPVEAWHRCQTCGYVARHHSEWADHQAAEHGIKRPGWICAPDCLHRMVAAPASPPRASIKEAAAKFTAIFGEKE